MLLASGVRNGRHCSVTLAGKSTILSVKQVYAGMVDGLAEKPLS
jgi:hypothetical protein